MCTLYATITIQRERSMCSCVRVYKLQYGLQPERVVIAWPIQKDFRYNIFITMICRYVDTETWLLRPFLQYIMIFIVCQRRCRCTIMELNSVRWWIGTILLCVVIKSLLLYINHIYAENNSFVFPWVIYYANATSVNISSTLFINSAVATHHHRYISKRAKSGNDNNNIISYHSSVVNLVFCYVIFKC